MDLEQTDILLKRRRNHIWINSEINDELLLEFQQALLDVQQHENHNEESHCPVTVHLHSGGGSAFAGLAIYDLLRGYPGEVTTIVEGFAASAASIILMAGQYRYIRPSGFILIHAPTLGLYGKYQEIKDHMKMLEMLKSRMQEIYSQRTKQSMDRVHEWLEHETWFSQDQAVAFGLAELHTNHP